MRSLRRPATLVLPVLLTLALVTPCAAVEGEGFTGTWRGTHALINGTLTTVDDILTIRRDYRGLTATLVTLECITPAEYEGMRRNEAISAYARKKGVVSRYEMRVEVAEEGLILTPTYWRLVSGHAYAYPRPVRITLSRHPDGRLRGVSRAMEKEGYAISKNTAESLQDWRVGDAQEVRVLFEREGAEGRRPPFDLEQGKIIRVTCIDAPSVSYSAYISTKYDPGEAACVVVNDAPKGGARPFAVAAAEELGWVSVGLPGAYDAGGFYVLRDVQKRFNLRRHGIYLSGFSEGARRNAYRANWYRDVLGGIIDVDMGWVYVIGIDPAIPVCFLVANKDGRREDWLTTLRTKGKARFRRMRILVYDAGHSWGPAELHDVALQWLAELRGDAGF
jgi:hypothetical protein